MNTERQNCAERRRQIIKLLQDRPHSTEELEKKLATVSRRLIQSDLEWLRTRLPEGCFQRLSAREVQSHHPGPGDQRVFYKIDSSEGFIPVADDLGILTDTDLLALLTARGLLDIPSSQKQNQSSSTPLADAIQHLIESLGIPKKSFDDLDILSLSHSTAEHYNYVVARTILQALRCGDALKIIYQPLRKKAHPAVVQPIRMVMVNNEPYLWAWDSTDKKLKNYKISRIQEIARQTDSIPNVPNGLNQEVRDKLLDSFAGVVGRNRRKVRIRFDAAIVPLVKTRILGRKHTEIPHNDGSLEISFETQGVAAVRHWLMQFGQQAVAIEPPELVKWMKDEATAMLKRYP